MILTPILWESSTYLRGSFNRLWDKFIYLWTKSNPLSHNKTLPFFSRTRATHYTISLHFSFTAFTVLRKYLKTSIQRNQVFLPQRRRLFPCGEGKLSLCLHPQRTEWQAFHPTGEGVKAKNTNYIVYTRVRAKICIPVSSGWSIWETRYRSRTMHISSYFQNSYE